MFAYLTPAFSYLDGLLAQYKLMHTPSTPCSRFMFGSDPTERSDVRCKAGLTNMKPSTVIIMSIIMSWFRMKWTSLLGINIPFRNYCCRVLGAVRSLVTSTSHRAVVLPDYSPTITRCKSKPGQQSRSLEVGNGLEAWICPFISRQCCNKLLLFRDRMGCNVFLFAQALWNNLPKPVITILSLTWVTSLLCLSFRGKNTLQ